MCETGKGHHAFSCCCPGDGYRRRFFTEEEKIAKLEEYKRELKNEINALDAVIAEIKKGR